MAERVVVLPRRCEIYALNYRRSVIMIQSIFFSALSLRRGITVSIRLRERSVVRAETELVLNQVLGLLLKGKRRLYDRLVFPEGILEGYAILHWVGIRIELSTASNPMSCF